MAVNEVDDWGFDAETGVPPPLPPELIEVEPPEAPTDVHEAPSRRHAMAILAVLFVFVVEIAWLVALGYGIVRTVL